MVPSAYLRVFQPLDGFPPEERSRWERYLVAPPAEERRTYRQRRTGRKVGLMIPEEDDGADVRVEGGRLHLCPRDVRVRVLAGLLAFRQTQPRELADAFVPTAEVRRARRELQRLRRRSRGRPSFVHQSPWHVPIRWFVLFDDAERRLEETPSGYRLRYVTTVGGAMRRADRAIPVLRRADLGPIAELLGELGGWLAAFDRRSLLELDYDGLCDGLTWDELDDDRSVRDVQLALAALAAGELPRSAQLYQGVVGRWAELRGREQLN